MIKVTFYRRNGVYYRFHEEGHSGLAEYGSDILCAAISAMTMFIINTIEVAWESNVEYDIDDETADITVTARDALPESGADEKKRYAISGLLYGYYLQLLDLTEDYYDYLSVKEVEECGGVRKQ
ncbi:MAG TPA: ribosomal-processing cysteine protease Prp [Bacillota bacterium]|nr:ribosomal-processing cysteine protease Prp [Clostridiales bacterium]HPT85961.1 ribosomal-processing cysteine protease Prp [Bacillota bacterium]